MVFPLKRGHRRGRAHFVAAALPRFPICALELGDRTSPTSVVRGLSTGLRRARSFGATASPVPLRDTFIKEAHLADCLTVEEGSQHVVYAKSHNFYHFQGGGAKRKGSVG